MSAEKPIIANGTARKLVWILGYIAVLLTAAVAVNTWQTGSPF